MDSNAGRPRNLLFILSDEHNRKIAGAYGHPFVRTPNIDRLSRAGTTFTAAYCNSPICVPARASLATGRYVHDIRCWDNATPYEGRPQSWHHMLRDADVDCVSIGKLHFRGGDDYGFTEELLPLHVVGGKGDLKGLLRKQHRHNPGTAGLAEKAGRGVSSYFEYDSRIAATAEEWIEQRVGQTDGKRFALFVSFVMPHFPLIAPAEYYDQYERYGLEELATGLSAPPPDHPALRRMRDYFDYDAHFDDEKRAIALRAYFGMVTRLDELVGGIVGKLESAGLRDETCIVYASDHGDNLGNRGMWGKSVMYEDSVGVPLIVAGPGVPAGRVAHTPVSLLDIAPTALAATGVPPRHDLPGRSLIELAAEEEQGRVVMAEYHAAGSDTGQFMIRKGRWKYVAFIGERPQLFDLETDPEELVDLGEAPGHADIVASLHAELETICDPEAVNDQAFADQQARIEASGGVEGIAKSVDIPFTPAPI